MLLRFSGVALVLCSCLFPASVSADEASEKAAVKAAKAWLELVDRAKYDESWKTAASIFRNAVTQKDWAQQVRAVRAPLGDVKSRKVTTRQYRESLPGAPDGKYVVIQFKSHFAKKKSAVETVTPMLDEDGKWHVSGYFIK